MTRSGKASRRTVLAAPALAAAGAAAPALAQPEAVEVPHAELAFTAYVQIGAVQQIGKVPGGTARVIPITGGTFEGPRLKGRIIPGGADWQLTREDGITELRAHYGLETDDGAVIQVNNHCLVRRESQGSFIRSVLTLQAPAGPHEWLNKSVFVGTLNAPRDARAPVTIRAFEMR